jgi:hypothetical protein
MNNAKVTFKRKGVVINQETGEKEQGTQTTILKDQPCALIQDQRASRAAFASGIREYNRPIEQVAFDDTLNVDIFPGDIAEVSWETGYRSVTDTYTVSGATLSRGIGRKWFVTIERIKTP